MVSALERLEGVVNEQESGPQNLLIEYPRGRLDLTAGRPKPPSGQTVEEIAGIATTVQSNTQILTGKTVRTDESRVRDLFDFLTAATFDPIALAEAVNGLAKSAIARRCTDWRVTNDEIASAAESEIAATDPHYDPANLGYETADAVENSQYLHLLIRINDRGLVELLRRTSQVEIPAVETPKRGARDILQAHGIERYVSANTWWSFDEILKEIHRLDRNETVLRVRGYEQYCSRMELEARVWAMAQHKP